MPVTCNVCPHECCIDDGEIGKCLVRQNIDGKIENIYYGQCSSINVTPIEKRPFFHFYPNSKYLSVGFFGCNFSCNFCLNHSVSQTVDGQSQYRSPEDMANYALDLGVKGIAFTYNEPTVYYEYIMDLGHYILVRQLPLNIVIKTNGFAHKSILRDLSLFVDAFNVDIKGDDEEYQRVCNGSLEPVMAGIEWLSELKTHLEISYLVLPRKINDMPYHERMRDWLSSLDKNIPIHILYFYPFHKMTEKSYEPQKLLEIFKLFRKKMKNVYISNVFTKGLVKHRNTRCRKCGKVLINRSKKFTQLKKLSCCGKRIANLVN